MFYKKLGSSDCLVPAIGQGASHVGSYQNYNTTTASERIEVWKAGFDAGLNLIDTAELYGGGLSEELVGKAISGIRDKVVVATKFNPRTESTRASVITSVENSLRRLRTDYIDLYQMHFPNPLISMEEVGSALAEIVQVGKVRFVGVSNFSEPELEKAGPKIPMGIVSNQVEYSLSDRSAENGMLSFCEREQKTLFAYSPLAQGRMHLDTVSRNKLESIAARYERPIFQVVLCWLISKKPVVALVKAAHPEHLLQNVHAADLKMSEEDLLIISGFSERERIHVPIDKIRLESQVGRHVYMSVEEALRNESDLIPSPETLARQLTLHGTAKPIQLVSCNDSTGRFAYSLDPYDILGQSKLYWAWKIAYGDDRMIPAYINEQR